jgi:outer membrane biogenesis lipoprotein LolB
MKKTIVAIIIAAMLLVGCEEVKTVTYDENDNYKQWNQFVTLEEQYDVNRGNLYIVYDKDTKVMYYLWNGYYKGVILPIYNADGSIRVYEGE